MSYRVVWNMGISEAFPQCLTYHRHHHRRQQHHHHHHHRHQHHHHHHHHQHHHHHLNVFHMTMSLAVLPPLPTVPPANGSGSGRGGLLPQGHIASPITSLALTHRERLLLVGLENGHLAVLACDSEYLRKDVYRSLLASGLL